MTPTRRPDPHTRRNDLVYRGVRSRLLDLLIVAWGLFTVTVVVVVALFPVV
jgi:hypothetical protein